MTPPLDDDWIVPAWPLPCGVAALSTTRRGGGSGGVFSSFNLADHVGDDPAAVASNRARLAGRIGVRPFWLSQVHGTRVVDVGGRALGGRGGGAVEADGAVSRLPGAACVVMTADCLPVLFCDTKGSVVGAAHAGWRGLCAGILEAVAGRMETPGKDLMAWLGPAIGAESFEVGDDVRQAFLARDPDAGASFAASRIPGKWHADIYRLARERLRALGIEKIYGGGFCTLRDEDRFFSYRRDQTTGRMATLIWRV